MHCIANLLLHGPRAAFNPYAVVKQPKNDDQVSFRLPAAMKEELIDAAERRLRGYNWLARDILLKWLANERRRKKKLKAR